MLHSKVVMTALVNGKAELDFAQNGWDLFSYTGRLATFTVTSAHVGRPDLLSLQIYGDEQYWRELLHFNNICDVWNDLRPGLMLKCPPRGELERWFVNASKNKKDATT